MWGRRGTSVDSPSGRWMSPVRGARLALCAAVSAAVLVPLAPTLVPSAEAGEPRYRLEDVERIGGAILHDPEDVAIDAGGNVYAGCKDGVIYRIAPDGIIRPFVETGGRPAGLIFAPNGNLLVCDPGRGEVLAVTPEGRIRVLANAAAGTALVLPDDIWAARDGTIYFTDASTYPIEEMMRDLIRGEPLGRLVRIARDGSVEVLRDGMYFPNGVILSPDEDFLYVAETPKRRILRMAVTEEGVGEPEVWVDELPGFVDGISPCARGGVLVAIVSVSEKSRKRVEAMPGWLRRLASHLPLSWMPSAAPEGMVLRIRPEDRRVEVLLDDPRGERIPTVTNVIDVGDFLYMGMYRASGIARLRK